MQSLSDVPSTSAKTMLMDYLKQNRALFSLSELERVVGCPKGTIHQAVNDRQELPDKWMEPLSAMLLNKVCYPIMELSCQKTIIKIRWDNPKLNEMIEFTQEVQIGQEKFDAQDFINVTQSDTNENHQ